VNGDDRHVLEVHVVGAHQDANLPQVERVDVVVVPPLDAAQIDAAQIPGKGEHLSAAVAVSEPLT
jgi:hypothetical protein